ncbi:MAG TPA: CocE/NonD family hydrolase [Verrucomicrobiae bacterium]|nr:CocE/NonD family hydrolase [Verrucomicrobiae bacterium]
MLHLGVAGMDPGQRRLNGPQTTGRTYDNLSQPQFGIDASMMSVSIPMRDGVELKADVYRPQGAGAAPALFAASPYPRQIQNSGMPSGFVEAGATDFWVPRGYAHVIVNLRGTCGSGGSYDFFGPTERQDMFDTVEWIAAQPWCDGNVGGIGISAFAMTQFEAAVEAPPHLRAIFAPLATVDLFDAFYHGGVLNALFGLSWLRAVSAMAGLDDRELRGWLATAVESALRQPKIHAKFEHFNGEAAMTLMKPLLRLGGNMPHPFDRLVEAGSIAHQVKDAFWQARDMMPLLDRVTCPTYLASDWQNVPVHLPSTIAAFRRLPEGTHKRIALLGEFGMTWPWESLHVEALAWFDHWIKRRATGILDGPPVRYVVSGAPDANWRTSATWPPPESIATSFALRADGALAMDEGASGSRCYVYRSPALAHAPASAPSLLAWSTPPLASDLYLAGPVELELRAASSGGDTAFIAVLQDVGPDESIVDVTMGCRRAAISDDGTQLRAVPAEEPQTYRIALVDNARCFRAGRSIRLILRGDDSGSPPAMMGFEHAPIGTATRVTIHSSSRLTLSLLPTPASR